MSSRLLITRTSINVMALTVTVLSVECYLTICHPFLVSKRYLSSLSRATKIICINWVIGLVFSVPFTLRFGLVSPGNDHTKAMCRVVNNKYPYMGTVTALFFYVFQCWSLARCTYALDLDCRSQPKASEAPTRLQISDKNEHLKCWVRLFLCFSVQKGGPIQ